MRLRELIRQNQDQAQTSDLLLNSLVGTLALLEKTLSKIENDLTMEVRTELENSIKDIDRLIQRIHDLNEVSFVSIALAKKKQFISDILKASPPKN